MRCPFEVTFDLLREQNCDFLVERSHPQLLFLFVAMQPHRERSVVTNRNSNGERVGRGEWLAGSLRKPRGRAWSRARGVVQGARLGPRSGAWSRERGSGCGPGHNRSRCSHLSSSGYFEGDQSRQRGTVGSLNGRRPAILEGIAGPDTSLVSFEEAHASSTSGISCKYPA